MISKTSIWQTGHGSGSVFVNMTERKESKIEFLHLVAQQYSSQVGVFPQQLGTLKFAEINFVPDDDALSNYLVNGITFADKSTILPCRALDTHIFLEPTTSTYMCTDYAVLNVASKTETFEPLTHLIPWDEQRECSFYAVWNQMPVYCRYCHEEDHVVANCPKRKARHTCWNCSVVGHIAAECLLDKPSKKARKQPEPPKKLFDTVKQHNIPPEVVQKDVCTPDEVFEELMEDLIEPAAQNNMSEPLDTTVPVDVSALTLNAETASKDSVKQQKKDRLPTSYVLLATCSKSTLLKVQPPTPEQDESVDSQSSVNDTDHLVSSSSGTSAGEKNYTTSLQ
ncbi:hypothetical protein G6F37_009855 [Rhizopus arrhizus]|nr:hypothetical protein G6F38_009921 [Rhizopus arrhizus]KAG1153997.1 hypothetical protein G6F37_009855 [Rhizopus arrhizus]